jgi:cell division protein FtsL
VDTLVTRQRFTLFVAVALVASVAWAHQFRHLTVSEIRAQVVRKRITDDGQWSQILRTQWSAGRQ